MSGTVSHREEEMDQRSLVEAHLSGFFRASCSRRAYLRAAHIPRSASPLAGKRARWSRSS